jgi:hypothetical protein
MLKMPDNLDLIIEYLNERDYYTFEERKQLRANLRAGIKKMNTKFISRIN